MLTRSASEPGDENLLGAGQALGVERGDDAARHAAVVANDGVDIVAELGQQVFHGRHRLVGQPALVRLIGDKPEIGVGLENLENPAAHRVGIGIARLPPDQRDIAFDRSLFGLEPCHHRIGLKLADGPAVLHHHGVERTVDQHRVIADHFHVGLVRGRDHASGRAGIDRLQYDDLRALRQHVFERRELGLLVVVGGVEDHVGAQRPGLGEECGLVSLVALLLHGLQQEADLDLAGRAGRIDSQGKRRRRQRCQQRKSHAVQDKSAVQFHDASPPNKFRQRSECSCMALFGSNRSRRQCPSSGLRGR